MSAVFFQRIPRQVQPPEFARIPGSAAKAVSATPFSGALEPEALESRVAGAARARCPVLSAVRGR